MLSSVFFLSSLLALSQAIPPPPIDPCKPYCADVYVISCRATLEVTGEGQIGNVAEYVQHASMQTVERVALEYPAVLEGYARSAAIGAKALKDLIAKQAGVCPEQKIVLLGYSQGAQVVGDAISGGGYGQMGDELIPGMSAELIERVTAIVLMGDPRHMASEEYQHGTAGLAAGDGVFPRSPEQMAILNGIKDKISSYCNAKDALCAVKGKGNLGGHYDTIALFSRQAREWVLEMVEKPQRAGGDLGAVLED
ncbi:Cutinase [Arthrobotrys entomopaga]|nr:Cutinase [Arthrobotrys entomopaga]